MIKPGKGSKSGLQTSFEVDFRRRFSNLQKKLARAEKNLKGIANEIISARGIKPRKYWADVEKRISAEYVKMNEAFASFSKKEIPRRYRNSVYQMHNKIKGLKSITDQARLSATKLINTNGARQIVQALYSDAVARFAAGAFSGQQTMKSLIRETQQVLVNESLINQTIARSFEQGNLREAEKLLTTEFQSRLAQSAIDQKYIVINGRRYNPRSYSELLLRTKFHEAHSQATKATAMNYGTDLVIISSHNTTTEICVPFEGKVFSLTGQDKRFPLLTEEPPFHPNCLHLMYPQFESGMEAQGSLKEFVAFSNGNAPRPPFPKSFVPISQRGIA